MYVCRGPDSLPATRTPLSLSFSSLLSLGLSFFSLSLYVLSLSLSLSLARSFYISLSLSLPRSLILSLSLSRALYLFLPRQACLPLSSKGNPIYMHAVSYRQAVQVKHHSLHLLAHAR